MLSGCLVCRDSLTSHSGLPSIDTLQDLQGPSDFHCTVCTVSAGVQPQLHPSVLSGIKHWQTVLLMRMAASLAGYYLYS